MWPIVSRHSVPADRLEFIYLFIYLHNYKVVVCSYFEVMEYAEPSM